ncbi:hypothetical protein EZV62_006929 [Acer yangbiense]|uniref:Uncharacterized protein n=1 Tax=Acer yangbiense TaxID=1000413 RepID=A0A5C7I932_9ROSI|nr:hypothetical protein EZV62_006929 [Acer yangbiense]
MSKRGKQDSSTSSCAHLRTAYHNCFNRSSWLLFLGFKKPSSSFSYLGLLSGDFFFFFFGYCVQELLDDKHLSHLLEAQGIMDSVTQPDLRHPVSDNASGVS